MAIRGAVIGGCIGFAFGHYTGAVLGAILGYRFENRILYRNKRRHVSSVAGSGRSDHYRVIGAKESDSNETLRMKYRELAKARHPDIIRSNGGSSKEVENATLQMMKINEAWEAIKKERGI